jgi:hypothetical protein
VQPTRWLMLQWPKEQRKVNAESHTETVNKHVHILFYSFIISPSTNPPPIQSYKIPTTTRGVLSTHLYTDDEQTTMKHQQVMDLRCSVQISILALISGPGAMPMLPSVRKPEQIKLEQEELECLSSRQHKVLLSMCRYKSNTKSYTRC